MKTLTYQPMTPAQWQQLTNKLEETFSLKIETASGSGQHSGFCVQWCYDQNAQSLTLECTQKPVWMPDLLLETKIDELVNKVLVSTQAMDEVSAEGHVYNEGAVS